MYVCCGLLLGLDYQYKKLEKKMRKSLEKRIFLAETNIRGLLTKREISKIK